MSAKFVIELESIKDGLNVIHPNAGPGVLDMYPAGPGQRTILPITREQFEAYSDNIRDFSTGSVPPLMGVDEAGKPVVVSPGRPTGNPVTLQLHVRDLASGKREAVSFAEVLSIYRGADDKAALAAQEAEAKRLADLTNDENDDDDEDAEDEDDATLRPLADAAGSALNVRG